MVAYRHIFLLFILPNWTALHKFFILHFWLYSVLEVIMRPSSLGGGRILRRTLSVCPSVRPSRYCFCLLFFTVKPSYERTSKIEKLLFSLMGQRHVCTFRHAQRAAYRTAISAAQTCFVEIYLHILTAKIYFSILIRCWVMAESNVNGPF